MLWSASFVVMAVNQQLVYVLVVRERFRALSVLTLACAVLALLVSYWGLGRYGSAGAPLGVLIGELVNTLGIALLCLREARSCAAVQTVLPGTPDDLPLKT